MGIKEEIRMFFRDKKRGNNLIFKTPYEEDVDYGDMIVSDKDDHGLVGWRPLEVDSGIGKGKIQGILGVSIHKDIVEYLNAYWFIYLEGKYGDYEVSLDSVTPDYEGYLQYIKESIESSTEEQIKIPIGVELNRGLILVDNNTGGVVVSDFDEGTETEIAESIESFIGGIK